MSKISTPLYTQLWPLPGGFDKYLDTLNRVLDWVHTNPHASSSEIKSWFRTAYNLANIETANSYLRSTIGSMGLINMTPTKITLTPAGMHYLQNKDKEFLLGRLLTMCLAVWEVLDAVRRIGPANPHDVHKELKHQFNKWESDNPFVWRLNWLLCFDCLLKVHSGYKITGYGEEALERFRPVENVGENPLQIIPKVLSTQQGQLAHKGVQIETAELAATKDSAIAHGKLSELELLITEIKRTALASDEAAEFEKALCKALTFLGLRATHKSGPGDTDILVEAIYGSDTYLAVVDGKSSKHGKITTAAVNWSALNKHRHLYNANYILVIAPSFSAGDLYNYAKETGAGLLSSSDLCEILRLHTQTPFSLTDLRDLFCQPGELEYPIQQLRTRHNEIKRLQQLVWETIDSLVENEELGGEPISADGLYHIFLTAHKKTLYKKSEIHEALRFLSSPFIGALRPVEDDSYILEMSKDTILRKLEAQTRTTKT
jgi:hypothetical protein